MDYFTEQKEPQEKMFQVINNKITLNRYKIDWYDFKNTKTITEYFITKKDANKRAKELDKLNIIENIVDVFLPDWNMSSRDFIITGFGPKGYHILELKQAENEWAENIEVESWDEGYKYILMGETTYNFQITSRIRSDHENLKIYKKEKIKNLKTVCDQLIFDGVTLDDGSKFSLSLTDQANLNAAVKAIEQGAEGFPYHADDVDDDLIDDEPTCIIYHKEIILEIADKAFKHILYCTTRFNHLKAWVKRAKTTDELDNITWDAELPQDLQIKMDDILNSVVTGE